MLRQYLKIRALTFYPIEFIIHKSPFQMMLHILGRRNPSLGKTKNILISITPQNFASGFREANIDTAKDG
jgi:hypothetical protein